MGNNHGPEVEDFNDGGSFRQRRKSSSGMSNSSLGGGGGSGGAGTQGGVASASGSGGCASYSDNKRRDNIKFGLEELQRVLPNFGTPEEEKVQ